MKTGSEIYEWRRSPPEEPHERRAPAVSPGPATSADDPWRRDDEKLDEALKGTFPASDPFSLG